MSDYELLCGDCRELLPALPEGSVHCCITSPPYWNLRDYGVEGQLGQEPTPEAYVEALVAVFRAVHRVLRDDGTLWLNLGDCYASRWPCPRRNRVGAGSLPDGRRAMRPPRLGTGLKDKDLVGIPWRVAFALQQDGWYLRTDIVWEKSNCLPDSVKDRPTRSHELVFLLAKQRRYFYDANAILEPLAPDSLRRYQKGLHSAYADAQAYGGKQSHSMAATDCMGAYMNAAGRNRRTVWRLPTNSFRGAHFAVFPPKLVEPCLLAGTSTHGVCAACGAPWARRVERQRIRMPDGAEITHRVTVGWRPTCRCGREDIMPATVLDPFAGVGTTGIVALTHGRRFLGIELHPDYCALAEARLVKEGRHV